MNLLSLDIETTGLDPDDCQIIEFAMVYTDTTDINKKRFPFRRLVCHQLYQGDPFALHMNAEILKEIANSGGKGTSEIVTKRRLTEEISRWLDSLALKGAKLTLAGKNVGSFDLAFCRNLSDWETLVKEHKIGHRCLDVGSLYYSPYDEVLPDLKTCMARAGLNPQVNHRALDDANAVLDVIETYSQTMRRH